MANLKGGTTIGGYVAWHTGNSGAYTFDWKSKSLLSNGGLLNISNPTGGNYNEGIRIGNHTSGWSNLHFGTDGSLSGLNVDGNQWLIGKNPGGAFQITKNGSSSTSGLALNSSDIWFNNNIMLHAGNYNSYSPTLTGTGASGTWGINITGNSSTSSYSTLLSRSNDTGNLITSFRNTAAGNKSWHDGNNETDAPIGGQWFNVESMRHSNQSNVYGTQQAYLWGGGNPDMYIRQINNDVFGSWARMLNSSNYNSYSPTLTGVGASGTWGININGNATTAGLLNPLNGDPNYKLGFSASGTRDNAGEWGRVVMRYEPNGQTYGIRVDRADYADSAGTATDSSKLPLTGGTMTGQLLFSNGLVAALDSTPSAISFGRVQTFGNLHLNADTDGSGSEYIFLTSGYGTGSSNSANGLAIGYDSLTWKNNTLLHAGNYGSYSTFSQPVSSSRFYTHGHELGIMDSMICGNWFRSIGTSGWFSQSYGGGIYMQNTTDVEIYGSKSLLVNNTIKCTGDVIAYYSDERLKTKKGNIINAIDKIKSLNGFYYENNELAKSFGYKSNDLQLGLSAQEVKAILPEVVVMAPFDRNVLEDGTEVSKSGQNYLTVNYAKLIPLLVESIKEQQILIEELKEQIEELKDLLN